MYKSKGDFWWPSMGPLIIDHTNHVTVEGSLYRDIAANSTLVDSLRTTENANPLLTWADCVYIGTCGSST